MREIVEEALRQLLTDRDPAPFVLDLPVTHGRRPPTVDVDSNAALEEYFDRAARNTAAE